MLLLCAAGAGAQDLEPRQYSNAPVGLNFFAAGYVDQEGNVLFDPTLPLENAELGVDSVAVGYARTLGFGAMSGRADIGVARVCLDGSADYQGQRYTRDECGWSDAKMRVAINFIGSPALSAAEFVPERQNLVVGASLQVTAPVGAYDPERLVNIGANRWAAKAEIGLSKGVRMWRFELAVAGTFHEDNDEFFGGNIREQDAIYALQIHLVRIFRSGAWLAVDSNHYSGGTTTTNGVENSNAQSNERLGVTVSVPVNRRQSLKFAASSGVSTRTGTDFDSLGIVWQYRWGSGL